MSREGCHPNCASPWHDDKGRIGPCVIPDLAPRIAELERALSASQERERVLREVLGNVGAAVLVQAAHLDKHLADVPTRFKSVALEAIPRRIRSEVDEARAALQSPPTPAPEPRTCDCHVRDLQQPLADDEENHHAPNCAGYGNPAWVSKRPRESTKGGGK